MSDPIPAAVALIRLIGYLRLADSDISNRKLLELSSLVFEGSETGVDNLFGWSLERLDARLRAPHLPVDAPMPAPLRASIGYDIAAASNNTRVTKP